MSATAVIGLQWGDEAKGKIVDLLTDQHDVVVRYQGGNNAGHTVVFGGNTYKLSLLPVGVLRPEITSVIATGVVINPAALLGEIDQLRARNVPLGSNLLISDRAHVIFPWHMAEEAAFEAARKDDAIGTTMRGIGTCYRDKAGRTHAIRIGDLMYPELLRSRVAEVVAQKTPVLRALNPSAPPLDVAKITEDYLGYADRLRPHVTDVTAWLHKALAQNKRLLFEGAQGSLLDVDHGSYPFVTSSSSSGCGIHSGSGVPERQIGKMIGVVKAYTTRVGGGPFPTELLDATGQHIRDVGREYGTVTGRPRRCGWFDAVAVRYALDMSGADGWIVTNLDVLSGFDAIHVATGYQLGERATRDWPAHLPTIEQARPVYARQKGWTEDITAVRRYEDLPAAARAYVEFLEREVGAPILMISVGPERDQVIQRGRIQPS
jgi:adenylosuccinate synthase